MDLFQNPDLIHVWIQPQPSLTYLTINCDYLYVKKCIFSKLNEPYENCPKAIILCKNPLLIAGGDGFMPKSGFDTCLDSASAITDILEDKL